MLMRVTDFSGLSLKPAGPLSSGGFSPKLEYAQSMVKASYSEGYNKLAGAGHFLVFQNCLNLGFRVGNAKACRLETCRLESVGHQNKRKI